ncbi:hypothetical protein VCRA2130O400_280016 [Vibrio crassostreae]|nr:hypothetical protein VCRA2119O385_50098 [Vibrio crassostreae]CAK3893106.1 hypothetical protein VCRA2130O400_280016 [Vibrio crassostreae]
MLFVIMYLKGTNYIYPCKVHFWALFEFYEFKVQKKPLL